MAKNYKSLNNEVHDMHLALERAYDRGYEQAKEDYSKPLSHWSFIYASNGEYECDNCKKRSLAPYIYCPICGCPMDETVYIKMQKVE